MSRSACSVQSPCCHMLRDRLLASRVLSLFASEVPRCDFLNLGTSNREEMDHKLHECQAKIGFDNY